MEPVRDLDLYRGLEQALGAQVATALMDRLPSQPADELATKADLTGQIGLLRDEMTGEIRLLREEMTGQIGLLREEMTGQAGLLRQEMTGLKHELLATVRGEMIDAIHTQGRQLAFTLAGSLVGLSGLAFALANLAR